MNRVEMQVLGQFPIGKLGMGLDKACFAAVWVMWGARGGERIQRGEGFELVSIINVPPRLCALLPPPRSCLLPPPPPSCARPNR